MLFTLRGTWMGRPVQLAWLNGRLFGDPEFLAVLARRAALDEPYDVLLVAASLMEEDGEFELGGEFPPFDEEAVEQRLPTTAS